MNIIFLDIDNVLNYGYSATGRSEMDTYGFADKFVSNLKYILDSVSCTKIVISSSWRMTKFMGHISEKMNWRNVLERKLGYSDIGSVILGDIPHVNEYPDEFDCTDKRGEDIQCWLELYGTLYNVERFAIIDDNCSCGTIPKLFPNEFVNVDEFEVGECLSRRNADRVISVLNCK